MMASTTTKRHDLRPLRRLFSRRPRARVVHVPDRIRIPAPVASSATTTRAVAQEEPSARCPACELRDYLSGEA
jgi:hypothetical protein